MKVLHYYIILALIIAGCNNSGESNRTKQIVSSVYADYGGLKRTFPDNLVLHFPAKIDESALAYGSSVRDNPESLRYLTLVKALTENEKLFYKALEPSSDSCLITIYRDRNTYGFDKKRVSNCSELFPVPELKIIYDDAELWSDIEYYVLEKDNNVYFVNDSYLDYYLPPDWENGMSRGVGISEEKNIIFYWLIMW